MNLTAILQSPSYCKKQLVGDNLRTKPKNIQDYTSEIGGNKMSRKNQKTCCQVKILAI